MLEDRILSVIDDVYEAGHSSISWNSALHSVAECVNSNAGIIYYNGPDPVGDSNVSALKGISDDFMEEYNVNYIEQDPMLYLALSKNVGEIIQDTQLIDYNLFSESEVYHDWYSRIDAVHLVASWMHRSSDSSSALLLRRGERTGPFEPNELKIFSILYGHVRRAMRLHISLCTSRGNENAAFESLDALSIGVITLDKSRRVLHANRYAKELLDLRDGIHFDRGTLSFSNSSSARAFDEACNLLEIIFQGAVEVAPKRVFVPRISEMPSFDLTILPTTRNSWISKDLPVENPPKFIVLLRDPNKKRTIPIDDIRKTFGLTSAEAEITLALAAGLRLSEIADRRATSRNTIRAQLATIFGKTDTHRQTELIQKIQMMIGHIG